MDGAPIMASNEFDLSPPPGNIIHTLRSLGYSPATAIADLIDNSITAGASSIEIKMKWRNSAKNSQITVSDNGIGLSPEELKNALRPGSTSPNELREPNDLGRFGLGMKTACWSMGKTMTVHSRKNKSESTLQWDLDFVEKKKKWLVREGCGIVPEELLTLPTNFKSGTVIAITNCDKIFGEEEPNATRAEAAFYETVAITKLHLEMVFHRFLGEKNRLSLKVNDKPCIPWDPFMSTHKFTQTFPEEEILCQGEKIRLTSYVLPHRDHLDEKEHKRGAGPKGWNLQQGFYIYRANRLIVSGGWIGSGSAKPDEHTKLARVSVDLSQNMDSVWNLNILKSQARPPANLRNDFGATGKKIRTEAKKAYENRAKRSLGSRRGSKQIIPMWTGQQSASTGTLTFEVNREHELVKAMFATTTGSAKKNLRALLRNLEQTLPIAKIVMAGFENEGSLQWDSYNESKLEEDIKMLVTHSFLENGFTLEHAKQTLLQLQPFCDRPEVVEAVIEAVGEARSHD